MFRSKDDRKDDAEAKKQRDGQIREMTQVLSELNSYVNRRKIEFKDAFDTYKESRIEKWEYFEASSKDIAKWGSLDDLGREGWELVGISTYAEGGAFKTIHTMHVFKRRIPRVPQSLKDEFADIREKTVEIEDLEWQITTLKRS